MVGVWLAMTAGAVPTCVVRADHETTRAALARSGPADAEVLARLTYAEGLSTAFPDDPLVYRAIAWGTLNRVRLSARSARARARYGSGIPGVVFQKGQFPPAVSTWSRFSKDFLCPADGAHWTLAVAAASEALAGEGNPFVSTDWEKAHGLSLVVNFYYPASEQARGPFPPWEEDPGFAFTGDLSLGDAVLPASRIRFYRLTAPPSDLE